MNLESGKWWGREGLFRVSEANKAFDLPLGKSANFFFLIKRRLARLNCMFKRLYGGGEGLGMDARG